jgi:CelD/BcsL family acetyltransferase involved in cellulose biosynthesis
MNPRRRLARFRRFEMKLSLNGPYREVEALEEVHAEKAIDSVLVSKRERLHHEA